MIHYHGTPISGPRQDVIRFLRGRHALVPFFRKDDIGAVAEACASFVFDNSAYSVWRSGGVLDVAGYVRWVRAWHRHPGFVWALIPDVIGGSESENDALLRDWPRDLPGVPVWHLNESLPRLTRLAAEWPCVALGSTDEWGKTGTAGWWQRMGDAMDAVCDDEGRPRTKLHGLRMLDIAVFTHLPLASGDSTNAGMNGSAAAARHARYAPPTPAQRAAIHLPVDLLRVVARRDYRRQD